jgi:hypothetical protein
MTHSQDVRIHRPCGQPMTPSRFGGNNPTPQYRRQPIWVCADCSAWEPRDGWDGPLPAGWDGQTWAESS